MTRPRRAATACWVFVSIAAVPERALAQKPEFVAGLAGFAAAVAGTGGDEGPQVLGALDRMSRAVAEWDRAIGLASPAAGARTFPQHLSLAGLLIDRGRTGDARTGDARRLAAAAAPAAPAGAGLVYDLEGRLARSEGDFAGALAAFTRDVRMRPNDPAAHKQLARACLEQDRADDAFAELVAALTIDPGDGDAHAAVGRIALDTDRPEEAVAALRCAAVLAPGRHETRYALATALQRAGDADAAARELAAFERAQRDAAATRRREIAMAVRAEEAALQQATGGAR